MRRRITRWALGTVVSFGLMVALAYGWFRTPWGQEWARSAIVEAVEPSLVNGTLQIEAVDTNLWSSVWLQGLELHNSNGRLVRVERVALTFAPWELTDGLVHVRSFDVDGLTARLTTQADGRLDLAALFGPPSPDDDASPPFSGLGVDVIVESFQFNTGTVVIDDTELRSFEFNGGLAINGSTVRLENLHLVADLDAPVDATLGIDGELGLVEGDLKLQMKSMEVGAHRFGLVGEVQHAETDPVLDLKLSINHLDADDLEELAGERFLSEALQGAVTMSGGLDALVINGELGSPSGGGSLEFGVQLNTVVDPMPWQVELKPSGLDVHTLTPLVSEVTRLNGVLTAVGEGTSYPDGMKAEISGDLSDQIIQGHTLDSLTLEAMLDQGVLSIAHLGLNGNGINAEVEGVANLIESTADVRSEVVIANLRSLSAWGVPASGGRVHVIADVDAGWSELVHVDVKASIDGRSIVADGASIGQVRTSVDATILGEGMRGRGTLQAEGIDSDGALVDHVAMTFELDQSATGAVNLNATTSVGKVSIPESELTLDGVEGAVEVAVDASGKAQGEGRFDISRAQYGGNYSVDGGPIRASIDGDAVQVDVNLRRGRSPFLVGQVLGDLGSGLWSVEGFELAILESKGFVADGPLKVALSEDGAHRVEARIVSPDGLGEFSMSGIADAENPDLHLMASQIRLGAIRELATEVLGIDAADRSVPQFGGELSMDFTVQAPPDEPVTASGWVELQGLKAQKLVDGLDVRIDTEISEQLATAEVSLSDDNGLVFWTKAHSDLKRTPDTIQPDCNGSMRVRSMLPGTRFKDLRSTLPVLSSDLNGRASLDVLIHGAACDPDVTAFGAVDLPVGVNGERVRVDMSAIKVGPSVEVEVTADQDGRRIAKASVEALTQMGQFMTALMTSEDAEHLGDPDELVEHVDARLTLNNADVSQLARMAGVQHPVAGVLAGGFGVTGSLESPVLRGGLVLVNGRLGAADLSQFSMSVEPVDRGFQVETTMGFGKDGDFELSGFLPSAIEPSGSDVPSGEMALQFGGAGIPVAVGAGPSGLVEAQGTVMVEGTISGKFDDPQVDVRLGTHDAAFTLLPTALRYEPALDVRVVDETVNVKQFGVRTTQLWGLSPSSGTFDLTGTVGFEDELDIDLSTTMDGFWLSSTRSAELATSGGVEISGTYPDLRIDGDLKLDDAKFVVGADMLKDTSGFQVDPMVTIHRKRRDVVERVVPKAEDSDTDRMTVDLGIDLGQAVRLRADVPMSDEYGDKFSQLSTMSVDLGLDGQLRVNQNNGVLSVVGELETLRGEATAMGKRFGIREGTVTFTGEDFANPQLNLDASHRVGQYGSVDIAIGGDVDHTSMELTSPEYPDQTDVMSMLLFGKPTSAMSETEGESGAGLLSAAMASVGGKAAKATGAAFLQNVQIDPGSGSVKVGFPLTDKVYLSIEKVNSDSDSDNMTQAAIEWILSRSTYGEVVTGDRGQSSGDIYWRWRF